MSISAQLRNCDGNEQSHFGAQVSATSSAIGRLGPPGSPADHATQLRNWLDSVFEFVDENDEAEDERHKRLIGHTRIPQQRDAVLAKLWERLPVFVYFTNYFQVRPNLHLRHLADRVDQKLLDDDRYDHGNLCLLKLLGFSARELAELGDAEEPADDPGAFEIFRRQLDERSIRLNAASVRLTEEIRSIWNANQDCTQKRTQCGYKRMVSTSRWLSRMNSASR